MAEKQIIKDDRRGRAVDTRRMEMRDAEIESVLNGASSDPLHIDKSSIPDGWEYHWVRDTFVGHVDNARMTHMNKKGWEPVPADRHPERINQYIPGRESPLSAYIHHRGLILCDRPAKWGKIEREKEERSSYQNMITPAMAQSMTTNDMRKAGWDAKVLNNQTNVEQEYRTFKD